MNKQQDYCKNKITVLDKKSKITKTILKILQSNLKILKILGLTKTVNSFEKCQSPTVVKFDLTKSVTYLEYSVNEISSGMP